METDYSDILINGIFVTLLLGSAALGEYSKRGIYFLSGSFLCVPLIIYFADSPFIWMALSALAVALMARAWNIHTIREDGKDDDLI